MSINPHKRRPRNPHFFGRQDIIDDLDERFKPESKFEKHGSVYEKFRSRYEKQQELKICVMHEHGFSRTGKTQIANEYTYRYEKFYANIFWVQADEPAESGEKVLARLRESSTFWVSLKIDSGNK